MCIRDRVKIGGLPPYRDRILHVILSNPGSKGMILSAAMEKNYGVRIHHATLLKYIVREGLFDAAAAAGGPIRSRAKQVHAKIANLRRYRQGKVAPMKGRVGEPAKAMKTMKYDLFKTPGRIKFPFLQPPTRKRKSLTPNSL